MPPRFRALFAQASSIAPDPTPKAPSSGRRRAKGGNTETPEWVPADISASPALNAPTRNAFTAVPVSIDPLGAVGDVAWTIHANTFNVRSGPSTTFSALGQLTAGAQVVGVYHLVTESDQEWIRFTYNGNPSAWISATGAYRPHPLNITNIAANTNLPYGTERVNRWWANPSTYEASDLVNVPPQYTSQIPGRVYQLRAEVATAVAAMLDAAAADGVIIRVGSPYRSWTSQRSIYQSAVSSDGLAQRYSAPPGHSEHQLGATMDFSYGYSTSFLDNDTPEHDWLVEHGDEYGFRQSYTADNTAATGYIEEPWHWRYWGQAVTATHSMAVY